MLYVLEQGPVEKSIIEQCIRQRRPLPPKIANAPELEIGLDFFYISFLDLSTCRRIGMGEGPIPWTAKKMYADDELHLSGEQREDFFYYIDKLDKTYLEFRARSKTEDK